ncbi:hypothetical protein BGZ51_005828 [Haplosporangium sp. Z 767]|nr:hypothetical protein BGZ50_005872 [Haplosporangium sp. Z 11]KAF9180872.1 hypothetical protein BGZ51_005828 [Haplosporangium sp. Z 767]
MAPTWQTTTWITRKGNYAMEITAMCDHIGHSIYFPSGNVGSVHDALVYKRAHLYTRKENFFQGQEYLLADAAYALTPTVILRFKDAADDEAKFNNYHSIAQVKIGHAFKMLN